MAMFHKSLLALLHLLHVSIIIFLLIGWLLPPLRPWHLLLCLMIAASWFGLGVWKGWGYCLITDMQWRLLGKMGKRAPASTYIAMLAQLFTGAPVNPQRVDWITQWVFYLCFMASLWVNGNWFRSLW